MGLRKIFAEMGNQEADAGRTEDEILLEEMAWVRERMRQVENRFNFTSADEGEILESLIYEMQALSVRMEHLIDCARRRGLPYPFYAMVETERMWQV